MVALMADVENMFHQVRVPSEDYDVLTFLWWPNGNTSKELDEYQMLFIYLVPYRHLAVLIVL